MTTTNCAVIRLGIIEDLSVSSPYKKVRNFVEKFGILFFPDPHKKIFTKTRVKVIADNIEIIVSMDLDGGPYKDKASATTKSILEILESDRVKPKLVLRIPTIGLIFITLVGRKFKVTRRI